MRRNLNFRESNKVESRANSFLMNCPARSVTSLCAIALNDLAENYHLEGASAEDIAKFIEFYDFLKTQKTSGNLIPIQSITTETIKPKKEEKKESGLVSSEAKDIMADVMSNIFS